MIKNFLDADDEEKLADSAGRKTVRNIPSILDLDEEIPATPEEPLDPYAITDRPPHRPHPMPGIKVAETQKPGHPAADFTRLTTAETVRMSGLAWTAGIMFFGSVGFMLILGWLVDLLLGSEPWGKVGGIILGSLIGFIQLVRINTQILKTPASRPRSLLEQAGAGFPDTPETPADQPIPPEPDPNAVDQQSQPKRAEPAGNGSV